MTVDVEKLVAALKAKREEQGLSLRKLSDAIGVSFSTLARIERGEGEPDHNTALRIVDWLGRDGERAGVSLEDVAFVHFRAAKNVSSKTIEYLLQAATALKRRYPANAKRERNRRTESVASEVKEQPLALSKPEMEQMASSLRVELDVSPSDRLPALQIEIQGVKSTILSELVELDAKCVRHLAEEERGGGEWSAMSVPLENTELQWVVLRNNAHTVERQRVTYLEECWHILLGHKLTKVARIADAYGRTYEESEEHDAFYLAAASLLPETEMVRWVGEGRTAADIGKHFETSPELVEYRIKRLGLWRIYKGLQVKLGSE